MNEKEQAIYDKGYADCYAKYKDAIDFYEAYVDECLKDMEEYDEIVGDEMFDDEIYDNDYDDNRTE